MKIYESDLKDLAVYGPVTIDMEFIEKFKHHAVGGSFEFFQIRNIERFDIKNITGDIILSFCDCKITELYISNCELPNFTIDNCELINESNSLLILNCTIKSFRIHGCNINSGYETLYCANSKFEFFNVDLCSGNCRLNFYENEFSRLLGLDNSSLSHVEIHSCKTPILAISHSQLLAGLELGENIIGKVNFSDSYIPKKTNHRYIQSRLKIDSGNKIDSLSISNCEILCGTSISMESKEISFSQSTFEIVELEINCVNVSIDNSTFLGYFILQGIEKEVRNKIDELSITMSTFSTFFMANLEVLKNLEFLSLNFTSNQNCINRLKLHETTVTSFNITTFRKFLFREIDFSTYRLSSFNFTDCEFLQCSWTTLNPGKYNERFSLRTTETNIHNENIEQLVFLKSIYSSFKIYFQHKEDYVSAGKFYVSQQEINLTLLNKQKEYFKLWLLTIDKYLSYFGESISRPFYWLMGLVFGFSYIFLFTGFENQTIDIRYSMSLDLNNLSKTGIDYLNAIILSFQNLSMIGSNKDFYLQTPPKFVLTQVVMAIQKILALVIVWRFINSVNRFMKK